MKTRLWTYSIVSLLLCGSLAAAQSSPGAKAGSSDAQKPAPETAKKPGGQASPSKSPADSTRPSADRPSPDRELRPEDREKATSVEILNLKTTSANPGLAQVRGGLKFTLPGGVEVQTVDIQVTAKFSDGSQKTVTPLTINPNGANIRPGNSSSPAPAPSDFEVSVSLPALNAPAFDCGICQDLASLDKGVAEAVARQCQINNCPVPPPAANTGGPKKEGGISPRSAPRNPADTGSISARSGSSSQLTFAALTSVKVTVTARFRNAGARAPFTKTAVAEQTGLQVGGKSKTIEIKR